MKKNVNGTGAYYTLLAAMKCVREPIWEYFCVYILVCVCGYCSDAAILHQAE